MQTFAYMYILVSGLFKFLIGTVYRISVNKILLNYKVLAEPVNSAMCKVMHKYLCLPVFARRRCGCDSLTAQVHV